MSLRNTTERPETVSMGSNELVGIDPLNLLPFLSKLTNGIWKESSIPQFWDGKTGQRIVVKLIELYERNNLVRASEIIEKNSIMIRETEKINYEAR